MAVRWWRLEWGRIGGGCPDDASGVLGATTTAAAAAAGDDQGSQAEGAQGTNADAKAWIHIELQQKGQRGTGRGLTGQVAPIGRPTGHA